MTATEPTVDPRRARGGPSGWALWFAVLGAPVAWLVHLAGATALVPVACETGSEIGIHALTVGTAIAAGAALLVAHRSRQAGDDRPRHVAFLAVTGFWLGVLFLALIVLEGLPVLVLEPCE